MYLAYFSFQVSSVFHSYDGVGQNLYMHSSSTVFAHCTQGKFVYIRAATSGKVIAVGNRSTFSGVLLRVAESDE